uniref:ATPase_AAA_core domain-containing protein n=1 Tax=Heterorhabditis bacteriophora TaxID=37862 RepID=A0A1I7XUP4_HETBA
MSRDTCSARGDPADSIRAVNALLTQIDRIRRRNNVVVLCTSNLENCLDSALLDRADVIHHVGQPSVRALYTILSGSIKELERIGLVHSDTNGLPIDINVNSMGHDSSDKHSSELLDIASLAKGLSGRCLRQVPALAWSKASEVRGNRLEILVV